MTDKRNIIVLHGSADYWYYGKGVNVIYIESKTKSTSLKWKHWQDEPIPDEVYKDWKDQCLLDSGYGVITGYVRRDKNKGKYLVCIDIDNKRGIEEFLSYFTEYKNIKELVLCRITNLDTNN